MQSIPAKLPEKEILCVIDQLFARVSERMDRPHALAAVRDVSRWYVPTRSAHLPFGNHDRSGLLNAAKTFLRTALYKK